MPPSAALVLGSSYHETLELNFKQKIHSRQDLPEELFEDIFADSWETRLQEEEKVEWEDEKPGKLKDTGIGMVLKYREIVSPGVQPVLVEQTFNTEIDGVKFIYILDLVDSNEVVIDHKTSKRSYSQDDVDKDLQASAAAYVLNRPIIFQNHVALKHAEPKIQIVESYRDDQDIVWWLNLAQGVVAQMKSGIAPPSPVGWHCSPKYCGYWPMCRGELSRSYR